MSNYDKYYDEELKEKKKATDEAVAKRKEDDAALKGQINATYDAAAESAAGVYREEMAKAPLDSRALYDQNAMREAIDRKKIQETLANMGMTDSGLSSSMHTALTVQKSRADNQVRADEKERIRAAESEIDRIFANNEIQKSQKGIEIDQATTEWERNQRANDQALAAQNATSRVNAEVEAATEAAKLELEAYKLQQSQLQESAKLRNDYATMLMTRENNPLDANAAWAEAYAAYPDNTSTQGVKAAYYNGLIGQGYETRYANVMTTAYTDALADGKTEEEASAKATEAFIAEAEKEVAAAGADVAYIPVVSASTLIASSGNSQLDRLSAMATATPSGSVAAGTQMALPSVSNVVQYLGGVISAKEMTDTGKMYALARQTGKAFGEYVAKGDDTTVEQVGKALEEQFSGFYLDIALSYAGLTYTDT